MALIACLATGLAGCVTIEDVRPVGDVASRGTAVVYSKSIDKLFPIVAAAARECGLVVREERPADRYVLADDAADVQPYGIAVGMYFEPLDGGSTRVRVYSRVPVVPLVKLHLKNYETLVHARIGEKMALLE